MGRIVVVKPSTAFQLGGERGKRVCGDCGACCKTHAVAFEGADTKPAGKWCQHWNRATHCGIYAHRPDGCRHFECEWLKGMGEDKHRPDRTKVVLDYITRADAPLGGILQMWELSEGSLRSPYAREATKITLDSGILVSHIHLSGRRRLFLTATKNKIEDILENATNEGFEVISMEQF